MSEDLIISIIVVLIIILFPIVNIFLAVSKGRGPVRWFIIGLLLNFWSTLILILLKNIKFNDLNFSSHMSEKELEMSNFKYKLISVNGVSENIANQIITEFQDKDNLLNHSIDEISSRINGIGHKTAEDIKRLFE